VQGGTEWSRCAVMHKCRPPSASCLLWHSHIARHREVRATYRGVGQRRSGCRDAQGRPPCPPFIAIVSLASCVDTSALPWVSWQPYWPLASKHFTFTCSHTRSTPLTTNEMSLESPWVSTEPIISCLTFSLSKTTFMLANRWPSPNAIVLLQFRELSNKWC